jgi:hypothetical protein
MGRLEGQRPYFRRETPPDDRYQAGGEKVSPFTSLVRRINASEREPGEKTAAEKAYDLLSLLTSETVDFPPGSNNRFPPGSSLMVGKVTRAYGFLVDEQDKFTPGPQFGFRMEINGTKQSIVEAEAAGRAYGEGYSREGIALNEAEATILSQIAAATDIAYSPMRRFFRFDSVPDEQEARRIYRERIAKIIKEEQERLPDLYPELNKEQFTR